MEIALHIFAALLFLAGMGICLLNACLVLRHLRRGTHGSMVPFWGGVLMVAGLWLRLPSLPWTAMLPFLMFDLSGLPSLLLLPFYLLVRALRGTEAAPLLPAVLQQVLLIAYMLWLGLYVLACGFFILSGTDLLPTPS